MNKKSGGFALIEVIVSMVILGIVFAAAVSLLYSVSIAIERNRDRLVASYLAQECLELVRNSRDTAWRNHHKWNCAWTESSTCTEKTFLSNNNISKNKVVVRRPDAEGNLQDTKFSRKLTVVEKSEAEVLITCHVSWKEGKLSISEILTNWRKI